MKAESYYSVALLVFIEAVALSALLFNTRRFLFGFEFLAILTFLLLGFVMLFMLGFDIEYGWVVGMLFFGLNTLNFLLLYLVVSKSAITVIAALAGLIGFFISVGKSGRTEEELAEPVEPVETPSGDKTVKKKAARRTGRKTATKIRARKKKAKKKAVKRKTRAKA